MRLSSIGQARGQVKPPGVPRINWSHDLAQGLAFFAWTPAPGAMIDLVSGVLGAPTAITPGIGVAGPQTTFSSSTSWFKWPYDNVWTSGGPASSTGDYTVATVANPTNASAAVSSAFQFGGTSNLIRVFFNANYSQTASAGTVSVADFSGSSLFGASTATSALSATAKFQMFAGARTGGAGSIWVNGVNKTNSNSTGDNGGVYSPGQTSNGTYVGNLPGTGNESACAITWVAGWNRSLAVGEHAALYAAWLADPIGFAGLLEWPNRVPNFRQARQYGPTIPKKTPKPLGIPTINLDHPLAEGLVFYAFDTGLGTYIDLIGQRPCKMLGTPPTPTPSAWGQGSLWGGAGSAMFSQDTAIQAVTASGTYTYACAYVQTADVGIFARPFGRTALNAGGPPYVNWIFDINNPAGGNGNQSTISFEVNSGGQDYSATVSGNAQNAWMSLAGVATGGASVGCWINGIQQATISPPSLSSTNTNADLIISGNSNAGVGNPWTGFVFYGALWNRKLTPDQLLQLHDDPWCLLQVPGAPQIPATTTLAKNLTVDPLIPAEAAMTQPGVQAPIEFAATPGTSGAAGDSWFQAEFLSGSGLHPTEADSWPPFEFGAVARADPGAQIEPGATQRIDPPMPAESLGYQKKPPIWIEWGSAVSAPFEDWSTDFSPDFGPFPGGAPVEFASGSASITGDSYTPIEALSGSGLHPTRSDSYPPLEIGLTARTDPAMPIEPSASQRVDPPVPAEWLGYQKKPPIWIEWDASVSAPFGDWSSDFSPDFGPFPGGAPVEFASGTATITGDTWLRLENISGSGIFSPVTGNANAPIELRAIVRIDPSAPAENSASQIADTWPALESSAYGRLPPIRIEWGTTASGDAPSPAEFIAVWRLDVTAPTENLGLSATHFDSFPPIEAQAGQVANVPAPTEALTTVLYGTPEDEFADTEFSDEFGPPSGNTPLEAGLTVQLDAQSPAESAAVYRLDIIPPAEASALLRLDILPPAEALALARIDAILRAELAGGVAVNLTCDALGPLEFLALARADPATFTEFLLTARADPAAAIEGLASQRLDAPAAAEALAKILMYRPPLIENAALFRGDTSALAEFAASVRADPAIPAETLLTAMMRPFPPLESVALGAMRDTLSALEAGALLRVDPALAAEFAARLAADPSVPVNLLSAFMRDTIAPAESLGIVPSLAFGANNFTNLEFASRFVADPRGALEWAAITRSDQWGILEALLGARADAFGPIESGALVPAAIINVARGRIRGPSWPLVQPRPFARIRPGETDFFAFDFTLWAGTATIVSTAWNCALAPFQFVPDPNPAAHVLGDVSAQTQIGVYAPQDFPHPLIASSLVVVMRGAFSVAEIGGFTSAEGGAVYLLTASVTLSDGRNLSLTAALPVAHY